MCARGVDDDKRREGAGVQWLDRSNFRAEHLPYELRVGGNRPGSGELWRDFDGALERLAIAASGTDVTAVAHAFRDVGEALLDVADELDRDDSWQIGSRAG